MLPLKTLFTNEALAASQAPNQLQNSENNPLEPQKPREGVMAGVCVQYYEQIHLEHSRERDIEIEYV